MTHYTFGLHGLDWLILGLGWIAVLMLRRSVGKDGE